METSISALYHNGCCTSNHAISTLIRWAPLAPHPATAASGLRSRHGRIRAASAPHATSLRGGGLGGPRFGANVFTGASLQRRRLGFDVVALGNVALGRLLVEAPRTVGALHEGRVWGRGDSFGHGPTGGEGSRDRPARNNEKTVREAISRVDRIARKHSEMVKCRQRSMLGIIVS